MKLLTLQEVCALIEQGVVFTDQDTGPERVISMDEMNKQIDKVIQDIKKEEK